jgi:integrase
MAAEAARPITLHLQDYLESLRDQGRDTKHLEEKERHLTRFFLETGITKLTDLTARVLEQNMVKMRATVRNGTDPQSGQTRWKEVDPSPSTRNARRRHVVAFANWCVKHGRLSANPLSAVGTLDERQDRRKVRRAPTEIEFNRLIGVARHRDAELNADPQYVARYGRSTRTAWYLCAGLAGLRRGDLTSIKWGDINFVDAILTIRDGKARRVDHLPIHPAVLKELRRIRPRHRSTQMLADMPVFPREVTPVTVQRDFERASIPSDPKAGVVDLHSLRTMFATNLARSGVSPQVAKKLMRHQNYRTTEVHYTKLGLEDARQALACIPTPRTNAETHASGGCQSNLSVYESRNLALGCEGLRGARLGVAGGLQR